MLDQRNKEMMTRRLTTGKGPEYRPFRPSTTASEGNKEHSPPRQNSHTLSGGNTESQGVGENKPGLNLDGNGAMETDEVSGDGSDEDWVMDL